MSAGSTGDDAASKPCPMVPLREAVEPEARVSEEDGQHLIEATLIRAGRSRMGNSYSAQVLREAVTLFEGARAFVDHPRPGDLPERSVRDLVGHYSGVYLDEDGERLRGMLHLVPGNEWLFQLMRQAEGNPNLCGLSIDALGERNARTGEVRKLVRVNSVDIVTRPSAGGQFDHILQSDRGGHSMPDAPSEASIPSTAQPAPADPAALAPARRLESDGGASAPPATTGQRADLQELMESVRRERDMLRCEVALNTAMSEAALPEPVARKLRRRFGGRVFATEDLTEAVQEERETLAALSEAGAITGMGYVKPVQMGLDPLGQLQAAFDGLFDIYESDSARQLPRLSGIREAFQLATGIDIGRTGGADRPLRPELQESLRGRALGASLQESEVFLREADVTTSSFSFLLGTSMNKRLLQDYRAWPAEWQKFTNIVAIKDFKLQDRVRLGAFGSLSTVAEDAPYTTLSLSDSHATYQAGKRGNLVQITRETIINDDLYAIKQIPQKLAVAAAYTLAEFVYGLLSPNGAAIYDTYLLFNNTQHANSAVPVANLGTANSGSALTAANLAAAVPKMRKQANLAGKVIGLKPRFLLVPPDLEFTAMTILKSAGLPGGNNNDINPMMGYMEPIVSPQLNTLTPASSTAWIMVADPHVIDTVEVGFVGGQVNPVLLIQDMPLYGNNFTQDVISYKVRHEYGGAVVDYRGFYLGNN